jgi:hypothetical protein
LAFDPISKFLACSSDKGTIHIFVIRSDVVLAASQNARSHDIDKDDAPQPSYSAEQENVNNTKSMLSFMGPILPKYFASEWSLAQFSIVTKLYLLS